MVGLDDLKGLFQPKWFYDCTINETADFLRTELCDSGFHKDFLLR